MQGLDTNNDGVFLARGTRGTREDQRESLAEFGYFTVLQDGRETPGFHRAQGCRPGPTTARSLSLSFNLPVKNATHREADPSSWTCFDPTLFVDFSYAPDDGAVTLAGAPQGCAVQLSRPKKPDPAQQKLSEDYFANANMGLQFASKVIVACP